MRSGIDAIAAGPLKRDSFRLNLSHFNSSV